MSFINIGKDNADKSYRYKMPPLVTKIEGRGNGIKTVIVNMVEVAKALHTDPNYPTKFFGFELGAQSTFSKSTERAIVNGAHSASDLAKILDKFIDQFIICPTCKYPEIRMEIRKSDIKIDCAACGHNSWLATNHKLKQYITKNPPEKVKGGKSKPGEKEKEKKKDEVVEAVSIEEPQREPEQNSKKKEVEWYSDVSKEAQLKRLQDEFGDLRTKTEEQKAAKINAIVDSAKADNKAESPVVVLKIFLAEKERDAPQIVSELKRLQLARGIDDSQRLKVLLEAVLDSNDSAVVLSQIKKYAKVLAQYTSDRASGLLLLACIEELIGVTEPKLLPKAAHILKALYDNNVLDEETIVAWYDSPAESSFMVNKRVAAETRAKAKPFVAWLKTAEEEE